MGLDSKLLAHPANPSECKNHWKNAAWNVKLLKFVGQLQQSILTGLSDIVVIFTSLNTLLQLLSWSSGADEDWGKNLQIVLSNFNLKNVIGNHKRIIHGADAPNSPDFKEVPSNLHISIHDSSKVGSQTYIMRFRLFLSNFVNSLNLAHGFITNYLWLCKKIEKKKEKRKKKHWLL